MPPQPKFENRDHLIPARPQPEGVSPEPGKTAPLLFRAGAIDGNRLPTYGGSGGFEYVDWWLRLNLDVVFSSGIPPIGLGESFFCVVPTVRDASAALVPCSIVVAAPLLRSFNSLHQPAVVAEEPNDLIDLSEILLLNPEPKIPPRAYFG
ncbi:hypothetical protein BX600DRAFT_521536 [Xylariales sp. PMI_506]|nr:hypothetical protein BX600DRAFT_521536 [Xylariales sp. PMI_506]